MVTRQPTTFALASPMPRPHNFRQLVTKYYMSITHSRRRRRMVRESPEIPPPLPPKDEKLDHCVEPSSGDLHDLRHDYAAHVVFLAQIDHEASHTLTPEHAHRSTSHTLPTDTSVSHPFPFVLPTATMPQMLSPAQLRRRREELGKKREAELREDQQEERARQARLKREKEALLRQQAEEENQRKLALEEELRFAALVKRQKEEDERRDEENRKRLLEERRSAERTRRRQHGLELQAWQEQQAQRAEVEARIRTQLRQNVVAQRRTQLSCRSPSTTSDEMSGGVTGWVTIQAPESMIWRRRFCRMHDTTLDICTDSVSISPIKNLDLSRVQSIKEWEDGCDELEGIPHSFQLELDAGMTWGMFTDSQEQKEHMISSIMRICKL